MRNFLVENDAVADQLKRPGRTLATPAQLLVAFALIRGQTLWLGMPKTILSFCILYTPSRFSAGK